MTEEAHSNLFVDFVVKFGKETIELSLPFTATVAQLKVQLEEKTHVAPDKQRLLLNAPVNKDKRRDAGDDLSLVQLFAPAYVQNLQKVAASASVPKQHVKVTAMLIGSSHVAPVMDSKATAEISRLVSTTVEHNGQWYRCCYGKGYLRQTAYVCRTCTQEGRADPDHAFCLACAEMCHGNHEVEEWGVRYYMRCDCCTGKCWNTPPEGYTRMPRLSDSHPLDRADLDAPPPEVAVMTSRDVSARFAPQRKRSRSSSPLTPKRTTAGSGGSPVSGVRVAAMANAPSPFSLQEQPTFETQAVTSPVTGDGSLSASQMRGGRGKESQGAGGGNNSIPNSSATAAQLSAAFLANAEEPQAAPTTTSGEGEDENEEGETTSSSYKPLPETERCMFVVDSQTGKPPVTAVLPVNSMNRYPRNPLKWCYCENDQPPDMAESGGIVCTICTTCFWSDHVKRLHSDLYRRVPCYGDVVQGQTIAFKCVDCNTYCCAPCRLRCHKNHTVEPEPVVPSHEEGTDNGAPQGAVFSCGCRGLCSIAETVPEEELEDASSYLPMPPDAAIALVETDVFTGFVCAHCMQENPWMLTDSPTKCYNGQLPAKVTGAAIKSVLQCGEQAAPRPEDGVYPWHGMIMPVNAFTEDATCTCAPCRAAFEVFAPRASVDATEMIVQLHDECDNCGVSLKDKTAFMCQTCEMSMDRAFMICRSCNELRLSLANDSSRNRRSTSAEEAIISIATAADTGETGTEVNDRSNDNKNNIDGEGPRYQHDLNHDFVEDTYENVYALAGMQMMQTMDAESLAYLQNNWDSVKDHIQVTSGLVDAFGQVPLSFSTAELEKMATESRGNHPNDKSADCEKARSAAVNSKADAEKNDKTEPADKRPKTK